MTGSTNTKKIKFDLTFLEKEFMQFIANIAGSQRQIDLDLITSLEINRDFLKCIRTERKKVFYKLITDPDIEQDEYLTYDFDCLEDIAMTEEHLNLIPEDVRTPLNLPTRRIMRKFRLPTHFYLWTLTWLDKGVKPKYPPAVVDLDILVRSKEYLKADSGLATDTKKHLRQLLVLYTKHNKLAGMNDNLKTKEVRDFFKKIPKNVHRKKPVISELVSYLEQEKETYNYSGKPIKKSSSYIAGNIVNEFDLPLESEGKIIKQVANKLRKRKSHYKAK